MRSAATGTAFYGVTPLPQGSGHIPTSADCVTCHASTAKFGPGTAMQHTGITAVVRPATTPARRFTGVTNLKTKPANHVPTTATCETCHAASNFTSLRRHGDEAHGYQQRLHDLSRRERDGNTVLRA